LVDAHLGFHDSIVYQSYEMAQTLVVVTRQVKDLVLEFLLTLLGCDGLLFLGFAFLRVFKVFLLAERAAIANLLSQVDQGGLDLLVDFLPVVLFDFLVMLTLSVHEVIEFVRLGLLLDLEREAALHLVEDTVDSHEFFEEVRAGKDEVP